MAQFTIQWDNGDLLSDSNNTTQVLYYRRKSIGGAWLTNGITPANPMAKTVNTATSPVDLVSNVVYEFKIESICTQNGPVTNDNGVIEQIGFACIEPDIVNTVDTSAIGIDLTDTDITKATFTLRKSSDNTIAFGPITANRVANMASVVASGLTPSTNYYWQIVLFATVGGVEKNSSTDEYINSMCGSYPVVTNGQPVQNLSWVAGAIACEKEGGYGIVKTITGLSSPLAVFYDEPTNRVYVADADDTNGNLYWFNPDTATTKADVTYSTKIKLPEMYNAAADPEKRKIYFIGGQTNGLIVYDIATDTITTVAYGNDQQYARTVLLISDLNIYANDKSTSSIAIIDREALTVLDTIPISSIPNNTRFGMGGFGFIVVGDELWAIAGSGSSVGTIGVYNADLSQNIVNITLPGAALWNLSRYWQTGFYDETSNRVYISDYGSNKRFVIDVTSKTVIDSRVVENKTGKASVQVVWTTNPITDELYAVHFYVNSYSDNAPIKRVYLENRTTYQYENMYLGQAYTGLMPIQGTNMVVGSTRGAASWENIAGYNTDGTVTILSNSIGTHNTGKAIVVTLKEVDLNAGNAPTGQTKNNVVGEADYIAPYIDTDVCEVSTSIVCPTKAVTFSGTTLQYEASLETSVLSNPNIKKIQIYPYNTNTASIEGLPTELSAPFASNYLAGEFSGLGGTNYTIQVRYLGADGTILQTC